MGIYSVWSSIIMAYFVRYTILCIRLFYQVLIIYFSLTQINMLLIYKVFFFYNYVPINLMQRLVWDRLTNPFLFRKTNTLKILFLMRKTWRKESFKINEWRESSFKREKKKNNLIHIRKKKYKSMYRRRRFTIRSHTSEL